MKLAEFSVNLSVEGLQNPSVFYEKSDFNALTGSMAQNYLIMENEQTLIGLFQGIFQFNNLTYNRGWDAQAPNLEDFEDIRIFQKSHENNRLTSNIEVGENTTSPASLMLADPYGNMILFDQHR